MPCLFFSEGKLNAAWYNTICMWKAMRLCLFPVTPLELAWLLSYHLVCARGLFLSSQQCSSAFPLPTPPPLYLPERGKRVLKPGSECLLVGALLARVGNKAVLACISSFDHRYVIILCNQKNKQELKNLCF